MARTPTAGRRAQHEAFIVAKGAGEGVAAVRVGRLILSPWTSPPQCPLRSDARRFQHGDRSEQPFQSLGQQAALGGVEIEMGEAFHLHDALEGRVHNHSRAWGTGLAEV